MWGLWVCLDLNESTLAALSQAPLIRLHPELQRLYTLTYLHVLVLYLFTGGDAVGDVQVDELRREVNCSSQPLETEIIVTFKTSTPQNMLSSQS